MRGDGISRQYFFLLMDYLSPSPIGMNGDLDNGLAPGRTGHDTWYIKDALACNDHD